MFESLIHDPCTLVLCHLASALTVQLSLLHHKMTSFSSQVVAALSREVGPQLYLGSIAKEMSPTWQPDPLFLQFHGMPFGEMGYHGNGEVMPSALTSRSILLSGAHQITYLMSRSFLCKSNEKDLSLFMMCSGH